MHFGKYKKGGINKKATECSNILGGQPLFDISSLLNPTFEGKKHWLLVIEDSTDFAWSYNHIILMNVSTILFRQQGNYKKSMKILKKAGSIVSDVDPCLYLKKCATGIVFVSL